jgi:hypothetical protein
VQSDPLGSLGSRIAGPHPEIRHQIADRLKLEHHSLEVLQQIIVHFSRNAPLLNRARLQSDGLRSLLFAHVEGKYHGLGPGFLESRHAHRPPDLGT